MKSITIQGKKRESVGKSASNALRNAGHVPCVVYGKNSEPIHFSTDEREFKDLVYTPDAHTVVLELEGSDSIKCILKDIQFHPIEDRISHADFYEYKEDSPITIAIPVVLEGRSRGVLAGGVLRHNLRKLNVKAIASSIPEEIVIDISSMRIGQKKYIRDIKSDEFTLVHPDNQVICMVKTARTAIVTDEDEDEESAEGEAPEGTTEQGDTKEESTESK